jgi:predicted ATPase
MAETKIFGREHELASLDSYIESGKGVYIINGPAGIGKSAVADCAAKEAEKKGYRVIKGASLPGCSAPYHVFVDAFKKAGLEDVLVYQPPKIERLFWAYKDGRNIKDAGSGDVDAEIFSGMFQAIKSFVSESLRKPGELDQIRYGSNDILIIKGENTYYTVILEGRATEGLRSNLKASIEKLEAMYKNSLVDWNGTLSDFKEDVSDELNDIVKKYTGAKYELDPKTERDRLFEYACQALLEENQKKPLLMLIDDLQWSDSSSLALLHYFARNNLKFLITYRNEDATKDSEELVANLKREGLYGGLDLTGLDKSALTQLMTENYGVAPENFVDRLRKETEGNPLFATEALKLLEQEKVISKYNTEWASKDFSSVKLPTSEGAQAIIEQRLSRLSESANDVLEWAAVFGPEFYESILEELSGKNPREFGKAIRELADNGIIKSKNGDLNTFSHSKLREFVYSRLRDSEISWMHEEVAKALEGKGSLEDLAWHYWKASLGDKTSKDVAEKSIKYNIKAAEDAKAKWANREALSFYSRALIDSLRADMDLENILQNMAQVSELMGELDVASNYYESLLKIAKAKNDPELEVKTLNNLGLIQITNPSKSLEYLNRALEQSKNLENKNLLYDIKYSLGAVYRLSGNYDASITEFEDILGADVSKTLKGKTLQKLGSIFSEKGEFGKAIENLAKSVGIFQEEGNLRELSKAYNFLGSAYERIKDYDSAFKYAKKSLDLANQINSPCGQAYACNSAGFYLTSKGDYVTAEKYLEDGIKKIKNFDPKEFSHIYDSVGLLYKKQGKIDDAIKMYEKAIEIGHCSAYNESEFSYDLGILYLEQGDKEKARACFENALKIIGDSECDLRRKIIENLSN